MTYIDESKKEEIIQRKIFFLKTHTQTIQMETTIGMHENVDKSYITTKQSETVIFVRYLINNLRSFQRFWHFSIATIYITHGFKGGLSLKIKNVHIHLYFIATKYKTMTM